MTPSHEAAAATARLEVLFKRRGTLNRMEDHLGIRTTDRVRSGRAAERDSARLAILHDCTREAVHRRSAYAQTPLRMRRDANSSSEVMGQEMRLLDQSAAAAPQPLRI